MIENCKLNNDKRFSQYFRLKFTYVLQTKIKKQQNVENIAS